jgi:S-adenosylmethionine hydrolase
VVYVDGFGNVALNLGHDELPATFIRLGHRVAVDTGKERLEVPYARTFSDVSAGQGLLYEDSARTLALAVNRESAAELLRLRPDDEVTLSPAG